MKISKKIFSLFLFGFFVSACGDLLDDYESNPLDASSIDQEICRILNELESISNQKQSSFPAHDIIRISDDEYEITLAVSGFNKKDISIDVHDGVLTIKGNGGSEVQDDNIQYIYKGIAKRSFEQKFRLEQYVDVKEAKLSNGLLTVSLLREVPEERKPRQITLKTA